MTPDIRRTLSLSLTLTHWTPLASQGLFNSSEALDASLTANITDFRSPITSPGTTPSSKARPLGIVIEEERERIEIRGDSVVESQHANDRFPRFFAYLLRNGTPNPESDEGRSRSRPRSRSRRSADPGGTQASLATILVAPTQCGVGDETGLQSCAAVSTAGTLGLPLAERSSSLRASTLTTPATADTLRLALVSDSLGVAQDSSVPTSGTSDSVTAMANYSSSLPSSRGSGGSGARAEWLLASTRKGADSIVGERITGSSSHTSFPSGSSSPNQVVSTSAVSAQYTDELDPDADEQDEQAQEAESQASGAQTPEEQPRKKKTRRAGVAITRVRRMQREVRRLAEEEEANVQRQQPGRVRTRLLYQWHLLGGSSLSLFLALSSPSSSSSQSKSSPCTLGTLTRCRCD